MRQRFFTETIQGKLIKNLLYNTYLPIYDTVRKGDYIIKNIYYVYNISLIKCTKSGTLEGTGEFVTLDYSFYYGKEKSPYTQNFSSNTSFYDSDTHEWLGKYLRVYKNVKGINLMPFYNCYSGSYTERFYLQSQDYVNKYTNEDNSITTVSGSKLVVVESNSNSNYTTASQEFKNKYTDENPYKVYQIPVKLNKEYTIALESNSNVKIAPAFINHGKLVKISIGINELSLTDLLISNYDSLGNNHPISKEFSNSSFIEPFIFSLESKNSNIIDGTLAEENSVLTYEQLFKRYERYLYLLVQVPKSNSSGIVVLEGNYVDSGITKIFSDESIDLINVENLDVQTIQVTPLSTEYNNSINMYECKCFVDGILFNGNNLKSTIVNIELDDDYGYVEYKFENNNSKNLIIYSQIQIPSDANINITYSNNALEEDIEEYDNRNDDVFLDNMLISKLALLQLNDNKNYPFSDTLIEYLLLNCIDSEDQIGENIKRIQDIAGVANSKSFTYGAWTNSLRELVFRQAQAQKTISHLDNIGYVDKTVETIYR